MNKLLTILSFIIVICSVAFIATSYDKDVIPVDFNSNDVGVLTSEGVLIEEVQKGYVITSNSKEPAHVAIDNPQYTTYALKHYSDDGGLISIEYINVENGQISLNITTWSYYELEGIVDDPFNPYNYYFWNSSSQVMTDGTGLSFKVADNGCMIVNNSRYVGFALTGTVNGDEHKYTSMDYEWDWSHEEINGDHVFKATNNDNQILWNQTWYFYQDRSKEMKIEHYLKNKLQVDITNTQMYYIITVKDNDTIQYNGTDYLVGDVKPLLVNKNLTGYEATINFNDKYDFRIDDIISDGFEINRFYIGNGNIVNKPNIDIMAIGFTKNEGVFPAGAEVFIDPTFSTSDIEAIDICALDGNTIVVAWGDETSDDITFRIYDTNGTAITAEVDVDDAVGAVYDEMVEVSAYNSTHFVVTWGDYTSSTDVVISYAVYNSDGNVVLSEQVLTNTLDYSYRASVVVLNETHHATAWFCREGAILDQAHYVVNDSSGNSVLSETLISSNAYMANDIQISAFSDTLMVGSYSKNDGSNFDLYFSIFDTSGNIIVTDTVVDDNAGGAYEAHSVATFNETRFVISWWDRGDQKISYAIYDSSGNNIIAQTNVATSVTSWLPLPVVSTINSTHFILMWSDEGSDVSFVINDSSGNSVVSKTIIDSSPSADSDPTAVYANNSATGINICDNNFVVGWVHSSSVANWTTYHSNGTAWDGVCEAGAPPGDTTNPTYSNNATNTTTASASVNFTIDYNDDTALQSNGQYKFSTNNSGYWVNSSLSNFTSTPQTIYNNTLTLNSTAGLSIGYRWYAHDNAGNYGNTSVFTVTTTSGVNYYNSTPNMTITISDSVEVEKTVASVAYYINVSDSITITDVVSVTKTLASVLYEIFLSDSLTIVDGIVVNQTIASVLYTVNKSDTYTLSDSVKLDKTVASVSYSVSLSDTITITDSAKITKDTEPIPYEINLYDTITLSDLVYLEKTVASVLHDEDMYEYIKFNDSINITKTIASGSYYNNVSDTITLTDSIELDKTAASVAYYINLSDSITIVDSINMTKTLASVLYYANVSDSVTIADSINITKTLASVLYYANVSESINISDSVSITKTTAGLPIHPTFELYSQTPTLINQSSTGNVSICWLVNHTNSTLNVSSLAFIYSVRHDSDYRHSLRSPNNSRALDMWRGNNRNASLIFENNVSITEGNIWKWSGGDINLPEMTNVSINTTHSYVYWNSTLKDTAFPVMYYLDRTEQQAATMTSLDISKDQDILIKLWSPEIMSDSSAQYLFRGYVDAHQSGLTPNKPLLVRYLNSSYDPLGSVKPQDSPYGIVIDTHNASTWLEIVHSAYNSDYNEAWIVNSSVINSSGIDLTDEYYIHLSSETASSKGYGMSVTDSATSTNLSFANTNTSWISISGAPFLPLSYTTNVFTSERHNGLVFEMKLYGANDDDMWGNSVLESTNIELAAFPPTKPAFSHFYYNGANDYDMDNVYNGTFDIVIFKSTDPDGGVVDYNITLHYANETLVTIINNTTDSTTAGVLINISFNSTPYLSDTEQYTLKYTATDDDGEIVYTWLDTDFILSVVGRVSGYVYYSPYAGSYLYLPDAVVMLDSKTVVSNSTGFYDFGYNINIGDKEMVVDRYGFINNVSTISVIGDYEYNVSMQLNPLEPIRKGSPTKLGLGGIVQALSILLAVMWLRRQHKRQDNK